MNVASMSVETLAAAAEQIPSGFVVIMGMGIVFVGLICIVLLCSIMSKVVKILEKMTSVSEPAKRLSEIKVTFAPSRVKGFKTSSQDFGPIEITVTSEESLNAHSKADSSKGFNSPFITFTHTKIFIKILRYILALMLFELPCIF